MKSLLVVVCLIFSSQFLFSQKTDSIPRKKITISRITQAPKIDGFLDDPAWQNAAVAKNFIERQPNNGEPAPDSLRTEVKIVYNDLGIYFGATLFDPHAQQVPRELTERDDMATVDFIGFFINGYNDRQQSLEFIVTAAGVQLDAKMTKFNEDSSWNAVWYSAVHINDNNWVVEAFIPYSEIRFPKKKIQEWGLNLERRYSRDELRFSWSPVNNKTGSYSYYDGEVYGIKNIQTPTRLSFQPYISTYVNNYDGNSKVSVNGGMDLKYGINDAFTLDMILIPDFGQTKFDDAVLNLSAIETQYNEQRPFFTEGTELFSKGNLFYSRRIGGRPSGTVELGQNEELVNYPSSVDLINALKVSGRTDKGLGIGFFNAVTKKTYAEVKDTLTNSFRKALVEPLSNYNVLVLDQRFGDNSSFSFVNTNVTRENGFRDANVSGIYMDITNKKNTLNYYASGEGSWVMQDKTKFGMEAQAGMSKINGKNRITGEVEIRTKDYDINDIGYTGITNYAHYSGYYGYRLLQPQGFLNNMYLNFNLTEVRRLQPDLFSNFIFNFNSSFLTKSFFNFGTGFETTPFGSNDIYEPRTEGRYAKVPTYYDEWIYIGTDRRKKFSFLTSFDWYQYDEKNRRTVTWDFNPTYRISDKARINLSTNITFSDKEQGFVSKNSNDIIFGGRNRRTVINSLEGRYIFNNKMALNLAFRHYYSEVAYNRFFNLEQNGDLTPVNFENTFDTTYNSWNVDLRYSWWFAPGSQLTLLYRNAIDSYINEAHRDFSTNFQDLFHSPQLNSLSLRVSYYLDYNRIKTLFGHKQITPESPRIIDPTTGKPISSIFR